MSEAKNAEAELAKVLVDHAPTIATLGALHPLAARRLARALLSAGYAKREEPEVDTLALIEVAARAIKPNAFAALDEFRAFSGKGRYIDHQIMLLEEECQGARSAADAAIYAIRSLKGQP